MGADRVRRLSPDDRDRPNYVWVQRWDSAADADEFAAAIDTHLDGQRRESEGTAFATARVAPETTVVFVGSERFVADAAVVRASNGSVRIAADA